MAKTRLQKDGLLAEKQTNKQNPPEALYISLASRASVCHIQVQGMIPSKNGHGQRAAEYNMCMRS